MHDHICYRLDVLENTFIGGLCRYTLLIFLPEVGTAFAKFTETLIVRKNIS